MASHEEVAKTGAYDRGYEMTPCFWGTGPGSLLVWLTERHAVGGMRVLDAGSGEGKNSVYLAKLGATVEAWDTSSAAIANGKNTWGEIPNLTTHHGDVRALPIDPDTYDLVVAYGLMHCLSEASEVARLVRRLGRGTKVGGFHVLCAFNDRRQDFNGAHPGFSPLLLPHTDYLAMYEDWEILFASDEDLHEAHPHDSIAHTHSLTRLVTRKRHG